MRQRIETTPVERPETRYARSGEVNVAYQVVGDGPFDLVLVPGFISNVEYGWEEPGLASFYRRLASFSRLILFDKRGTGLSDRVTGIPTLETRMDDVRAILDAVGSKRAAVIGYSEGASMSALFAATYPERTAALIMYGSFLAWDWMAEGRFPTRHESARRAIAEIEQRWGSPDYCDELLENDAPSMLGDDAFRRLVRDAVAAECEPVRGGGSPANEHRHRRAGTLAVDPRPDADRPSRGRPERRRAERALRGRAHRRSAVRRASG